MFDDFLIRAGFAALGVAIPAALLGCFVVWRRMAYFGDATAHAAVLGVALALGFGVSIFAGVGLVALTMALTIHYLTSKGQTADTILGVFAHGALALGLVSVALIPGQRVDLDAYLFGDVLTVSKSDLIVIWGGAAVVISLLAWQWPRMLTATVSPDLAAAAGHNPRRAQLILTLMLAAIVAVAIKVVGALLITALLIIPAATARVFARTPEQMAMVAAGVGALSAIVGLWVAVVLNTGVGPTIVCTATLAFAVAQAIRLAR